MKDRLAETSRYLSYILRHNPQAIGLKLDKGGWASVDDLISAAQKQGKSLDRDLIYEVVATNDKRRFTLSEDGRKIRANQGHSIKVELGLGATAPPRVLYHGTAKRFMESINQQGLLPSGRHHVHLSADFETAYKVGKRHGVPTVLQVDAERMYSDGAMFYLSTNGVWLTDKVDPEYFTIMEEYG